MDEYEYEVDPLNLLSIEWLEQMGNFAPTERQIQAMESLLMQKLYITTSVIKKGDCTFNTVH